MEFKRLQDLSDITEKIAKPSTEFSQWGQETGILLVKIRKES